MATNNNDRMRLRREIQTCLSIAKGLDFKMSKPELGEELSLGLMMRKPRVLCASSPRGPHPKGISPLLTSLTGIHSSRNYGIWLVKLLQEMSKYSAILQFPKIEGMFLKSLLELKLTVLKLLNFDICDPNEPDFIMKYFI